MGKPTYSSDAGTISSTFTNKRLLSCLTLALLLMSSLAAFALEPPRPGEIKRLKESGVFEERLGRARALGNHRIDKGRLDRVIYKSRREALLQQGLPADQLLHAPPLADRLMPTKGDVKIFALLIDFLDYPALPTNTQTAIHSALFGDGSLIRSNLAPYESLNSFYERSSYAQLHLSSGMTLGWYHAPYNRSAVPETTEGRENLIKDAIMHFNGVVDFSQFDNDGNGEIEYFIVIWTGPDNGWSNFWWGYQTSFSDQSYTVDGKSFGRYSWQWEYNSGGSHSGPFRPDTVIHETGHGLGLPDYYDYDNTVGPDGGVGRLDTMDGVWGDHNCFSKWVLEWITPIVVASGSRSVTLNPSGTSQDAVLVMPGATSDDSFREFFMAQNRYRSGNDADALNPYPTDGMLVWHVDARLNSAGTNWLYDNSYSSHKLLKLMEADGLERIENSSFMADAEMYYQPGKVLTPTSNPSSKDYMGVDSRVNVLDILKSDQQMTATFSIDDQSTLATLTVGKAGAGNGTVTGDVEGIACGSDCRESFLPTTVITLSASAVPGSRFTGWSGGCSGTGECTISLTADTTVTATFDSTVILDEDFDPANAEGSAPIGWSTQINAGSAWWWFTYDIYNNSGGAGECALGATYGDGPFDSELRTFSMDLSGYGSVGIEFKTSSWNSEASIAEVDVSINGSSGPWIKVWSKTGRFGGPQTVNVDLSSVAAGHDNVMIRFHLYGPATWWVIDDVKVMAAANLADTTTTIASNLNPTTYGETVIFTATVSPSSATGTVTFRDGVTTLGTAPLTGGIATYSTSTLGVGIHSITAVYPGDGSFNGSTAPALTLNITQAAQEISITTHAPAAKTYGASFTVAASATGGAVVYSSEGGCINSGEVFTMASGTTACIVRYDQPGNDFYGPAPQRTETVSARPAVLSVIADPKSKLYGAPDPPLTFTVTGFVGDDTISIMTGSLTRAVGEKVGNYPILLGSLSAGANYAISYNGANLTINMDKLTITTDSPLETGTVGTHYEKALAAAGGVMPYRWSVLFGRLPNGLALNASTGVIAGTPTSWGNYTFTIQIRDSQGATRTKSFKMSVVIAPLKITTDTPLPDGTVGNVYRVTLAATGGVIPYRWRLVSGKLPLGLTINGTTGVISGTPLFRGSFSFTVKVSDNRGTASSKTFTMKAAPSPWR